MTRTAINQRALAPGTDRCLAILELLAGTRQGLGLSDIARRLGISKNMAFRVLHDLSARGYAFRDEAKTYSLGRKLLALAVPRVDGRSLVEEAAPEMRLLCDACGEGVGLLVPVGGEAVLVHYLPARHPIRIIYELGVRIPLHANAPGKVLLAFASEAERAERLRLQDFKRFTARTITSATRLDAQCDVARRRGYAVDLAEELEGVHCAAAPVFDGAERLVAALVATGPMDRIPARRLPTLGRQVAACARRIGARLGR
jgi:IclR family transcriptional regulator, KDG regulon repressor